MFSSDNVIYVNKKSNIKDEIYDYEDKILNDAAYQKYTGMIILAGGMLQLGISLKNVDIVALFTGISSSDVIYQMMFRSMTEIDNDTICDGISFCPHKKYGFMVDMNPHRTLLTLNYLADELISDLHKKDEDKTKLLQVKVIKFQQNYLRTVTSPFR